MRKRRRSLAIALVGLLGSAGLTLIDGVPASADAGDLDPTFGNLGNDTNRPGITFQGPPSPPAPEYTTGTAVTDGAGRIVMGGGDGNGTFDQDSVLSRLDADGKPDSTFNGGVTGIEFDAFNNGQDDRITGLAVHPTSGDIYVASTRGAGGTVGAGFVRVMRFGPNGAGPSAVRDFEAGVEGRLAFSSGRLIVATMLSDSSTGHDFDGVYVTALSPIDLTTDFAFGTEGSTILNNGGTRTVFQALAVDASGRILAGAHQGAGTPGAHLFRINPADGSPAAGDPDPTFGGGDGHVRVQVTGDDWITSIAPHPDGRIAVAGRAFPNSHVSLLDPSGNFVTTFDGDGKRPLAGAVWTVAWDGAGRLLYGQEIQGVVGRLLPTAADDTSFGTTNGRTAPTCTSGPPDGRQVSLIVQPTRVVTVGDCVFGTSSLWMFAAGFQVSDPAFSGLT